MHTEMWEHAAVQENLATLRRRGVHVLEPEAGRLAGGDVGRGPARRSRARSSTRGRELLGRAGRRRSPGARVLVTAGGTREPIDPVRFVGNRSSGKMGHAVADAARRPGRRGRARHHRRPAGRRRRRGRARSRPPSEMRDAVLGRVADAADVVVMAAAVADFRPKAVAPEKLKKGDGVPEIVLEPTADILAELGARKRPGQVVVGFAAETERRAASTRRPSSRPSGSTSWSPTT